jgi:hypothetical protein
VCSLMDHWYSVPAVLTLVLSARLIPKQQPPHCSSSILFSPPLFSLSPSHPHPHSCSSSSFSPFILTPPSHPLSLSLSLSLSGPIQTTHLPPRVASRPHIPQGLSVCLSVCLNLSCRCNDILTAISSLIQSTTLVLVSCLVLSCLVGAVDRRVQSSFLSSVLFSLPVLSSWPLFLNTFSTFRYLFSSFLPSTLPHLLPSPLSSCTLGVPSGPSPLLRY